MDLEITSASSLEPLLEVLRAHVTVVGTWHNGRTHFVGLELLSQRPTTPDQAIRAFARVLKTLPAGARRAWKAARKRCFNIGIQASTGPAFETELEAATLAAVVALDATVVFTVYEPVKAPKREAEPRGSASGRERRKS